MSARLQRAARLLPAVTVAALLAWLVGYLLLMTLAEALGLGTAGAGAAGSGAGSSFTLAHFAEFARRADEWQALWQTLWISTASVVLAALIEVPLKFIFERNKFPSQHLLNALIALPIALPPLVGVITFLFLYSKSSFVSRTIQAVLNLAAPP